MSCLSIQPLKILPDGLSQKSQTATKQLSKKVRITLLPTIYKINEIFESIQGEGLNTGRPAIFVRLSGCNLSCKWCDTKEHEIIKFKLTAKEVLKRIQALSEQRILIVITGGEPMMQPLSELFAVLSDFGYIIAVETNGTIVQQNLDNCSGVFYAVAPKSDNLWEYNIKRADEIKIVVDDSDNCFKILKNLAVYNTSVPIWLQPESNRPDMIQKCEKIINGYATKNKLLSQIRIGHQIHKIRGWK